MNMRLQWDGNVQSLSIAATSLALSTNPGSRQTQ
ncbi:hypothetical protein BDI4_2070006 [Burkholderia diffusa]|nr:hypothetical protein BDI4_2070006 [Burkholderia diffusa]